LYYTVILLSIFVFPHIEALRFVLPASIQDARQLPGEHIYYYLLLPQIPLAKSVVLPFAEPTWSIGVEEIFYLLVPALLLFRHVKKYLLLIIGVLFILAKYTLYYTVISNPAEHPIAAFSLALLELSRFECILLGCYIGYLYKEQHPLFLRLTHGHVIAAVVLLIIATAMVRINTYQYYHFAVCFAVIILYAAKKPLPLLNNRVLAFIGKISFSLYMTHEIAIVFLHNSPAFMEQADATPPLFLYVIIPLAAIMLATVSYYVIERPFLLLKSRVK
jgi:peptidoglycan/LPS O-acetylase OafA/YrhL